jgi:DNA-binding IclR family transcriptional regulator
LSELGVLEQDDLTSDFRPGLEFYRLAANLLASSGLTQAARRPMQRLARETGEAVYFSLRQGDNRVVIDSVPGWRQLQYNLPLGEEVSLYIGSSGLAILAWMPETEVEALIQRGLPRHSPRTITDPQELRRTLQTVRTQGYSSTFGQHTEEGVGVSAPVFGAHSTVIGSLLLTIPVTRLETHGPLHEIGRSVRCAADEISLRLGGQSAEC